MFRLKRNLLALLILFYADHVAGQYANALKIEGRTMGTSYSVTYFDDKSRDFTLSIDSILKTVNHAISNYDASSDVSAFNASVKGLRTNSIHFRKLVSESLKFAQLSNGNFDPTVMPLVNLWGFGPLKGGIPSKQKIDSIKKFVGYHHIELLEDRVVKDESNVQIDFGGIGQGYGVDVISNFLRLNGVRNFLVELGGEGFAAGKNLARGDRWKVGIINPFLSKDDQQLMGYAFVEDEAFTTSGNYFNYRIIDGKKYGHTISPFTGFPVDDELVSVSLFANDCTTADAWDTAFLVCGKDKAIEFLKLYPAVTALLIYVRDGRPHFFISESLKNKIFLEHPYDH